MTDTSAEHRVVVNIFGESYPITGQGDPTHISRVADFLDSRMRDVSDASRIGARDKVAILAAMSIASELQEQREQGQQLEQKLRQKLDQLIARVDAIALP